MALSDGTEGQILEDIARALDQPLSEVERTRARRDLARLRERLVRRDYAISGYGTNTFDIPDRAEELLTEIDFHASLGRVWAAVLSAHELGRAPRVLDLCPGWTPKVELGLLYAGFSGEVLLLDQNAAALAKLERFLALFGPKFSVRRLVADLFTVELPPQPVVIGHHLIDDVAIDAACGAIGLPPARVYSEESAFREVWGVLLGEPELWRERLTERLSVGLHRLVAPGGALLLAQYPSYTERLLGLHQASAFSRQVLDLVAHRLMGRGYQALDLSAARGVSAFAPVEAFVGLRRGSAE